jgi:hypothetical protein
MLYKNQPGFIKFALGENVKQANWGITNPTRFPKTRMGVEQVFTTIFSVLRMIWRGKITTPMVKKET